MNIKSADFWGHLIAATFAPLLITIPVFLSVAGICLFTSGLDPLIYKFFSLLSGGPLELPDPMETSIDAGLFMAGLVHLICFVYIMRGKCDPKPNDALAEAMLAEVRAGTFHHPTVEDKERMSEEEFTRRSLFAQELRKLQEKQNKK